MLKKSMPITLTPEQEAWLGAHVASGDFATLEEGARRLLDERIAELSVANDDLTWAKPLVDEAREAVARGDIVSLENYKAHIAALLASIKS